MAIVKDHKGQVLAAAEVTLRGAERSLGFKRIDCPEKLFAYYFLRGERSVRVEVDDVQFVGRLVTRWQDNHRLWAVAVAAYRGEVGRGQTEPPPAVPPGDGPARQRRGPQRATGRPRRERHETAPGLVPTAGPGPARSARRDES